MKKQNIQNITLIGQKDNSRMASFEKILNDKYVDSEDGQDYTVFFDPFSSKMSQAQRKEALNSFISIVEQPNSFAVLDLSISMANVSEEDLSHYALIIICADHLTCSSSYVQEEIYEITGRLAEITHSFSDIPVNPVEPVIEQDEIPNIAWYGSPSDIMSIKPYLNQKRGVKDLVVYTPSVLSNTKTTVYRGVKSLHNKLTNNVDIVYLPKVYTRLGEQRRIHKALESIQLGKLVVAPKSPLEDEYLVLDTVGKARKMFKNPSEAKEFILTGQKAVKKILNEDKESVVEMIANTPDKEYRESFDATIDYATDTLTSI